MTHNTFRVKKIDDYEDRIKIDFISWLFQPKSLSNHKNEKFVKVCLHFSGVDLPLQLDEFFDKKLQNPNFANLRFAYIKFLSKTC